MLDKKLDGMNNLYILSYDKSTQTWTVADKVSKRGADLEDLGLLKE